MGPLLWWTAPAGQADDCVMLEVYTPPATVPMDCQPHAPTTHDCTDQDLVVGRLVVCTTQQATGSTGKAS